MSQAEKDKYSIFSLIVESKKIKQTKEHNKTETDSQI